jgi:hypothetical protein
LQLELGKKKKKFVLVELVVEGFSRRVRLVFLWEEKENGQFAV